MRMHLFGMAFASIVASAGLASAGYVATTGVDTVDTPGGPAIGATFATPANMPGTFVAYVPDTPQDPQITGGDLAQYKYSLSGQITAISGNVIDYAGTYEIFYNNPGLRVSAGTFTLVATFGVGNTAALLGTLTQTQGPNNQAFADLGAIYGYHPANYVGTFDGNNPGVSGTIQGELIQTASVVPEPGTVAGGLFGVAVLAFANRRRKARAA